MDCALQEADDALTRFIKTSIRVPRPAEVEEKRVDLMAKELLTVRQFFTCSQLKMRWYPSCFATWSFVYGDQVYKCII